MTDQAPDDIFALYSRFELDGDNYRIFQREMKGSSPPAAGPVATARLPIEERESTPLASADVLAPRVERVQHPSLVASETITVSHREPTLIRPETDVARTSSPGLWSHGTHVPTAISRTPEILACDCISVTGVAGGVGTTTIVAVLTRLLAKTGRRCAIFDDTEDPTLPIFFGAQRLSDEHRRFAGLRSIFESSVRILNRKTIDPMHANESSQSFIERNFTALAEDFDHLVFDRPARSFDSSGAGVRIYVAIPDLSSLARIQKLQRDLDSVNAERRWVLVLNRFDSSIPLHKELLGWYRENFRDLIVIRESSLVPESLAEATTVVDWIPDSPVSGDFLNLFAAVRESLRAQSERLPLCS